LRALSADHRAQRLGEVPGRRGELRVQDVLRHQPDQDRLQERADALGLGRDGLALGRGEPQARELLVRERLDGRRRLLTIGAAAFGLAS
jgi:hypothetical protein